MDPKKKSSEPPRPPADELVHRHQERLDAIERELGEIFFRLVKQRIESIGTGGIPRHATLELSMKLPAPGSLRQPANTLAEQVERSAERCADRYAAFPLGHVYCHWCRSFTCAHATPPEPRCVFGGYGATGQPSWPELASVLLERRDPRIESIFREQPLPLTLVQGERELASEQLSVYGKRSPIYRILGQVVLGYLSLSLDPNGKRSLLAVTMQAVESSRGSPAAGSGPTVMLNILGSLEDGTPAYQVLEESCDPRVGDALLSCRRRLSEVSLRGGSRRRRRRERQGLVLDVLQQLARNLDRIFRQHRRRTRHSRRRHSNRGRPTSTALKDALRAQHEEIYRDVEERTWVVLGPKSRVHVFNDQAQHVTSVVYPSETVRYRTRRGKWLLSTREQAASFQDTLRRDFLGGEGSGVPCSTEG